MAHTPGPWHYGAYLGGSYAVDKVGPQGDREAHIADCHGLNARDNARRIAAAVNACQGIPTEALEAGVLQEMREALVDVEEAFNTWLKACPIGDYHRVAEKVQAALRKAREEAPS